MESKEKLVKRDKKEYTTPEVVDYGSIQDITAGAGGTGEVIGGTGT